MMTQVISILNKYHNKVENLLPILLELQDGFEGYYIPPDTLREIADSLKIPYAQISEVISFYAALNTEKKGKFHIEMCNSTVCRVNENYMVKEYLEEKLGIEVGQVSDDGIYSLDYAPCFGACDVSPSIRINKKAYGKLTIEKLDRIFNKLRSDLDG